MSAGAGGTAQAQTPPADQTTILGFFAALHGDRAGYLPILTGTRCSARLSAVRERLYPWPAAAPALVGYVAQEVAAGREVYAGAHLLQDKTKGRKRDEHNAAPIAVLWADVDHDRLPASAPPPTYIVESSPGRWQAYWHLTEAIAPDRAEELNRRLAIATNADGSGWDLGQVLRIPGTPNRKHAGLPQVRVLHEGGEPYHPEVLEHVLPPAPPRPQRPRRDTTCRPGDDAVAGGIPPVCLEPGALAVWQGQAPKTKPNGEVDRSASLMKIGRVLFDAGATRATIEAALTERDAALGYEKYTGRSDAREQYARIVDELERQGRTPRILRSPTSNSEQPGVGDADANDPCASVRDDVAALRAEVAQLRKENDELRAEVGRLRKENSVIVATATNPNLKAEAVTALRLVANVAHRRDKGEQPDAEGFIRVSAADLGEDWEPRSDDPVLTPIRGRSTVNRHLQNLDAAGLLERKVRPETIEVIVRDPATKRPVLDPATGKPKRDRLRVQANWIRITGDSVTEMLDPFARYRPAADADQASARKTHGGKREKRESITCPHCGCDDLQCRECGALVNETAPSPGAGPFQDETVENDPPDTYSVDRRTPFQDETRCPDPDDPFPDDDAPPRDRQSASRSPDPDAPWASAWLAGMELPDAPPLDHRTDVAYAARR